MYDISQIIQITWLVFSRMQQFEGVPNISTKSYRIKSNVIGLQMLRITDWLVSFTRYYTGVDSPRFGKLDNFFIEFIGIKQHLLAQECSRIYSIQFDSRLPSVYPITMPKSIVKPINKGQRRRCAIRFFFFFLGGLRLL